MEACPALYPWFPPQHHDIPVFPEIIYQVGVRVVQVGVRVVQVGVRVVQVGVRVVQVGVCVVQVGEQNSGTSENHLCTVSLVRQDLEVTHLATDQNNNHLIVE